MHVDHSNGAKPDLSPPLNKNLSGPKAKILRAVNNNSQSNVSTNDNSAPGAKLIDGKKIINAQSNEESIEKSPPAPGNNI